MSGSDDLVERLRQRAAWKAPDLGRPGSIGATSTFSVGYVQPVDSLLAEAADEITRLRRAPPVEWKPPKDGTAFLAFDVCDGEWVVTKWQDIDRPGFDEGGMFAHVPGGWHVPFKVAQPLPPPPKAKTDE